MHTLFQVSEVTGVEREAVTNVMNVNDLTLANAATTVPDFTAMGETDGESLIVLHRNFILALEGIENPTCWVYQQKCIINVRLVIARTSYKHYSCFFK